MTITEIKNQRSTTLGVVFQPSRLMAVTIDNGIYNLGASGFLVKIDSDQPVSLLVQYVDDNSWITTTFFPGWNADWIKSIDTTTDIPEGTDIKVGF